MGDKSSLGFQESEYIYALPVAFQIEYLLGVSHQY